MTGRAKRTFVAHFWDRTVITWSAPLFWNIPLAFKSIFTIDYDSRARIVALSARQCSLRTANAEGSPSVGSVKPRNLGRAASDGCSSTNEYRELASQVLSLPCHVRDRTRECIKGSCLPIVTARYPVSFTFFPHPADPRHRA